MTTTAIVAEILIVGLETVVWLGLLIGSLFGTGGLRGEEIKGWETLATIFVLAAAYALGVIVDRLADSLFKRVARRSHLAPKGYPPLSKMRLRMMQEDNGVTRFLEYQRSRIRVMRATTLNVPFIFGSAVLYLVHRARVPGSSVIAFASLGCVSLAASFFVTRRIQDAYNYRLMEAYEGMTKQAGDSPVARRDRPVAAAICYRTRRNDLEFLLVRTSDGRRWTFPKGHVEVGETLPAAAAREAKEEAGVRGRLDPEPVTSYRYPDARIGARDVTAYLLAVQDQRSPAERHRKPKWGDKRRTLQRLVKNRAEEFGYEHERVLAAAEPRIRATMTATEDANHEDF